MKKITIIKKGLQESGVENIDVKFGEEKVIENVLREDKNLKPREQKLRKMVSEKYHEGSFTN